MNFKVFIFVRRTFFLFLLIVSIILLNGCTRPVAPPDTLRVGLGAEPASLDPHLAQGLAEVRVLSAMYEGLVLPYPTKEGETLSAGVANAWQIKEGGCKIVFRLRSDARWSNGERVTAEDFVQSWKRAMTPSLAAPNAGMFDAIEGAKSYRQGKSAWEQVGIKATSPDTLEVRLEEPSAAMFVQTLVHPIFYPVYRAKELPTVRGKSWVKAGQVVGNGAFVLKEQKPYEKLTVVKNEKYWCANKVGLQKIEFYPIDNRSSEEMAFLSGVLDVTMSLPLNKVQAYKDKKDPRLRVDPALQVGYLLVNVRRAPLERVEARRALSMALNRGALCTKVLRGGQSPAYEFVPAALKVDGSARLAENTTEAKEILAQLTQEERAQINKLVLRFNTSEARKLIAETLQAQWAKELGVKISLENLEWKTFLSARQKGEFDLAQAGWSADFADPANFLELFVSDNPNNVTGWANAEYDAAVRTRDFPKAQEILLSELPCIPLFFQPNVYLLSERVKGWQGHPMDLHDWRAMRVE